MRPLITLTTDFGTGSPYVAQIKGVVLSLSREANFEVELLDITHAIGPQNIREGAVVLLDTTPRFPPGTINVAVVDPGVGTSRRLIYAEIGTQRYLAPDNGLLSLLVRRLMPRCVIALEEPQFWLPQPSRTFHGRDILAPVAAHLAAGLDPSRLGSPLAQLEMLDCAQPRKEKCRVVGEVLYVDSFGNLITNIGPDEIAGLIEPSRLTIECGGREVAGIVPTYGAALAGELIALFDSQGRLEIALVNGNAAASLGVRPGERVTVR